MDNLVVGGYLPYTNIQLSFQFWLVLFIVVSCLATVVMVNYIEKGIFDLKNLDVTLTLKKISELTHKFLKLVKLTDQTS